MRSIFLILLLSTLNLPVLSSERTNKLLREAHSNLDNESYEKALQNFLEIPRIFSKEKQEILDEMKRIFKEAGKEKEFHKIIRARYKNQLLQSREILLEAKALLEGQLSKFQTNDPKNN